MKLQLTPELLGFLSRENYTCRYSRTLLSGSDDSMVTITLTPVRYRPNTRKLPAQYDTYFSMRREPVQMVSGVEDVLVMVEMDKRTLILYLKELLSPLKGGVAIIKTKQSVMQLEER